VRSRPRDLAADSENRLQSARGRARARRRRGWRSRGAQNLRAARARLAGPPSAALWRSESVWRPIRSARGSPIGTRASASRLIDLTLASPRDPELCRRPLQQTRSGVGAGILRSASASPVCAARATQRPAPFADSRLAAEPRCARFPRKARLRRGTRADLLSEFAGLPGPSAESGTACPALVKTRYSGLIITTLDGRRRRRFRCWRRARRAPHWRLSPADRREQGWRGRAQGRSAAYAESRRPLQARRPRRTRPQPGPW
jgi:hypothetical protein